MYIYTMNLYYGLLSIKIVSLREPSPNLNYNMLRCLLGSSIFFIPVPIC